MVRREEAVGQLGAQAAAEQVVEGVLVPHLVICLQNLVPFIHQLQARLAHKQDADVGGRRRLLVVLQPIVLPALHSRSLPASAA